MDVEVVKPSRRARKRAAAAKLAAQTVVDPAVAPSPAADGNRLPPQSAPVTLRDGRADVREDACGRRLHRHGTGSRSRERGGEPIRGFSGAAASSATFPPPSASKLA